MRSIGFILVPDFQVLALSVATAFELANAQMDEKAYDVRFLSTRGGLVRSSIGLPVQTDPIDAVQCHTTIVVGSMDRHPAEAELLDHLRAVAAPPHRVAAICTGSFILAEAGLLDGRRATTHWAFARDMQQAYPTIKVEEDRIFIIDGNIWTSAGMTAGLDLALALIDKDLGPEVSKIVAKKLVIHHRRAGGQSQFSALLELAPKSDRIQSALIYARSNLRNELSVEELAEAACLSPRQFSRVFREETGQTPAKAVEQLRLEAARAMMEDGRHSIEAVVRETGFADRERMRRAFLRVFGQPPQVILRQTRLAGSNLEIVN